MRRIVPLALAGAALGIVLGVVVNALSRETYRATAILQVAPGPDPRAPSPDARPVAADVLAESYARLLDSRAFMAQLAPRVAGGRLDPGELDDRVDAERPDGTSLVEVRARRPTDAEAVRLAGEVVNVFLILVQQLEQQRAVRVEAELRRRLDELTDTLARTRARPQLDTLRTQRRALAERLAALGAETASQTVTQVAGPGGSAEQIRPVLLRNLLGGALLGLVAGLGAALLTGRPAEPRPAPLQAAAVSEPVSEPEPPRVETPRPSVSLVEPGDGAVVAGVVQISASVSADVELVRFLLSDGSPDWVPVVDAPPRLAAASWDTTTTADGDYWLCALATTGEAVAAASEPRAITVSNGTQFHWTPDDYPELIRAEVPAYERLQGETAEATRDLDATRILELGIGTGETARQVRALHPGAELVGIDSSEAMLAAVPQDVAAELRVADLADPLPPGPFDLVISALAVHHLQAPGKADLFERVAAVLRPRGRFVLADVVVPDDPDEAVTPISPGYDFPERVGDLLQWLRTAGLDPRVTWADRDLVVIAADRPA